MYTSSPGSISDTADGPKKHEEWFLNTELRAHPDHSQVKLLLTSHQEQPSPKEKENKIKKLNVLYQTEKFLDSEGYN